MTERHRQKTSERKPPATARAAQHAKTVDTALEAVRGINVFDEACPGHQVIARLGNKWTLLVVYALCQGPKRYTELQRQIDRISPKMLTQVLRNLEKDGLVSRKVFPVVPPMVEYSFTPLGASLSAPLASLCVWANENYSELATKWCSPALSRCSNAQD